MHISISAYKIGVKLNAAWYNFNFLTNDSNVLGEHYRLARPAFLWCKYTHIFEQAEVLISSKSANSLYGRIYVP